MPGLLIDQSNDMSLHMSLGFQVRNNPRLHRFKHAAGDLHGGGGHGAGGGSIANIFSRIETIFRKIGDAFTPQEYDTLNFKGRDSVKVPRGRPVTEGEWAVLNVGRKVNFSPRIGVSF